MKYQVKFTSVFKKDYRLARKRGCDLSALDRIIETLAEGNMLPDSCRDHLLVGNYQGHRECHIAPDWLLIYKRFENILVLELVRTGAHADLFN